MDLWEGSPALMQRAFRNRWAEVAWNQFMEAKLQSSNEQGPEIMELKEKGCDHGTFGRVLRSRASKALSFKEKKTLVQIVCDVVPTPQRLCAWGITTTSKCACGLEGSLEHLAWLCPLGKTTRDGIWAKDLLLEGKQVTAAQHGLLRGWFPKMSRTLDIQEEKHVLSEALAEERFLAKDGPIYTDGSGLLGAYGPLARAGASAIQLGEGGPPNM